jgi:hypothetical protein
MYLVSDASHSPLAVFTFEEDAIRYLCELNQIGTRFSVIEHLPKENPCWNPTVMRVFVEADGPMPEKTLGYLRSGVMIEHTPRKI